VACPGKSSLWTAEAHRKLTAAAAEMMLIVENLRMGYSPVQSDMRWAFADD